MIIDARPIKAEIAGTENELTAAIYEMFRGRLSSDMARQISRELQSRQRQGSLSDKAILDVINAIDFASWKPLVQPVEAALTAAAGAAVVASLWRIGVDDSDPLARTAHKYAEQWAKERAAELVGMRRSPSGGLAPNPNANAAITDSTRDMVRQAVLTAVRRDWPADRLAEELRSLHAFSPERALNIARTELAGAVNSGQLMAYKTSGLVSGVRWVTRRDNRVEIHCRENERAGTIEIGERFPSGHEHPPAHPNCRCRLAAVTN